MTYRVGYHQPQNVYRDDAYIGVMFTAEDAALVVEALNGRKSLAGVVTRGWLIEHVDLHDDAPVEGCTFCPAEREPEHCRKPVGENMLCARPRGHGFPPCGFPVGGTDGELAS